MTLILLDPPTGVAFPLNARKVAVDSKPFLRSRTDGVVDSRLLRFFVPSAGSSDGCGSCSFPPSRQASRCTCGATTSSNLPCTCRASSAVAIAR